LLEKPRMSTEFNRSEDFGELSTPTYTNCVISTGYGLELLFGKDFDAFDWIGERNRHYMSRVVNKLEDRIGRNGFSAHLRQS